MAATVEHMACNRFCAEERQADAKAQKMKKSKLGGKKSNSGFGGGSPRRQDWDDELPPQQPQSSGVVRAASEATAKKHGAFGFAADYRAGQNVQTTMATDVRPGTTVFEAAKRMRSALSDVVLIASGDRLDGILTDTDIVKKVVASGKDPNKVFVEEIMTPRPQTIDASTPCQDALKQMVSKNFRHIPVWSSDSDGSLAGITNLPMCLYDSLGHLEACFHKLQNVVSALQNIHSADDQDQGSAANAQVNGLLDAVMQPTVSELLQSDQDYCMVDQSFTVQSAAALMKLKNLSAVLITKGKGDRLTLDSILSSKDIVRRVVAQGRDAKTLTFKAAAESTMTVSTLDPVSYTHLRAHETPEHLVCRLLLEKKKKKTHTQ
eukprot:TRINITY_DN7248_c0_g2_i2.p1 TRINITY_DN7248_c0_g2~~TRINITY_DN7248_c0_g2_i2.p1  ORF type:complete len:377 (+),score=99.92 TRINITY_DN7248_c0_g2_i2:47-1177(+)